MGTNCRFWILMIGLLALTSIGCTSYTLRAARVARLEDRAPIAIAVLSTSEDANPVAGNNPTVLEQYLTTALLNQGYTIRVMRPEMLTTKPLMDALVVSPYTDLSLIDVDVDKGGATRCPTSPSKTDKPTGGSDEPYGATPKARTKTPQRNEVVDAHSRHKALLKLAASIRKEWKIKYLVFAHEFSDYGFAAQVVRLEDKMLIFSMVVSGDKAGFEHALGPLKGGAEHTTENDKAANSKYLRFAEFLAEQI